MNTKLDFLDYIAHLFTLDLPDYEPSHCWYYHLNGVIVLPEFIEPAALDYATFSTIPKDPDKLHKLKQSLTISLQNDIQLYMESCSSLKIQDIDTCMPLSLHYAHISYHKGFLNFLNKRFFAQQTLF